MPEPSRADLYEPLPPHLHARWMRYGAGKTVRFAELVGLVVEDVRVDYCRMCLPWRTEISQPFGVAHGGAVAGLLDSVVVPAIGAGYEDPVVFATTSLSMQYLGALRDEDAIAEGWVTKRGRSTLFCEAIAIGASSGRELAHALMTFQIVTPGNAGPPRSE